MISLNCLGINLLTLFCKLDLFIPMQKMLLVFIKWSSLQKSVSSFTPKYFYEIDPWLSSHRAFSLVWQSRSCLTWASNWLIICFLNMIASLIFNEVGRLAVSISNIPMNAVDICVWMTVASQISILHSASCIHGEFFVPYLGAFWQAE